MTPEEWLAIAIWSLVMILSAICVFKSTRLTPAKITAAKNGRLLDAILILIITGWAIQMFTSDELPGWITGALMTATVICCVIDMLILNRYLDRTEGAL